jgi:hypothetical protein
MTYLKSILISVLLVFLFLGIASAEKATPFIQSFSGGELSPLLDGRTDLDKYYSGTRTLENMIPLVEGPATRMPGTYFALETKESGEPSRLIPFQFSTIQSYVLEVGDEYIRVFKDDGLITTIDTSTKLLLHADTTPTTYDFYTVLLLHANGTDGSTTFTDSGVTAHTVTANGNTALDTDQKKFGTASGLFPGTSGDDLSVPDHANWFMGTGTFTVDFWFRPNSVSGSMGFFQQKVDVDNYVSLNWNSGGDVLQFFIRTAASDTVILTGTAAFAVDTWYHIAVVRGWGGNANDWALTLDGAVIGTLTDADAWPDLAALFEIGEGAGATFAWGHIDEFRVSKGVARWTAAFTPESAQYPFTAAPTFTDSGSTTHTITANGNAETNTTQYKFATSAAHFGGGSVDYVYPPDHADWYMSTGNFTVDFWLRFDTVTGDVYHGLFGQAVDASNYSTFYVRVVSGQATFYYRVEEAATAAFFNSGAVTVVADTWYHVALIRGWGGVANTWAITVDGEMKNTATIADDWPDFAGVFIIGAYYRDSDTTWYSLNGWLDEFRVSKGVARWTADFTPPTQEYPFEDTVVLTGGGSVPLEITTTYDSSDVFEIKTVQSADRLYLFHPDYPPKTLTRTSHTSWTFTDFQAKVGVSTTITGITQANPAVVTGTTIPATLAEGDIIYISGVVGMTEVNNLFFTAGTVVTGAGGTVVLSGINSTAYGAWASGGVVQETMFGTTDNNPSCGTFFEERLVLGGSNDNPQTFALSVSADYEDFTLGADADDAMEYTLASDKVDRINWMVGYDYLMIGTVGGLWKVGATTASEPMTPTNVTAKRQATIGVKNISPEVVSDALLWVTRAGTGVRQFVYAFEVDKWIVPDMTRIAGHIAIGSSATNTGIEQLAFQRDPLPILWAIRADGQLLGMTYEIQEKIYGWFRIVTDGEFESVAVISEEDQEDQIWVIVNRTIDGNTARYVEYFKPIEFFGVIEDAFFVHSGLTWDGSAVSTLTGLDHLEGETVAILGDGLVQASKTVSGGSITLDTAASKIHVGLPYTSIVEPMKLNAGHERGTARGKRQRIHKIVAAFYQTGDGVEFGPSQSDLKDFNGFTAGSLTTDDLSEVFHGDFTANEATITIQQADPLPMTILGIVPYVTVNED